MLTDEYSQTSSKKGRGRSTKSLDLIDAMVEIVDQCKPITGRGVGYKLFSRGLIPSMKKNPMQAVYRLLRLAREEGAIDWEDIVDETRSLEKPAAWDNPQDFLRQAGRQYRREFWNQQPLDVEVWSEKGTIRGVLDPVLHKLGVGFRVMHGFSSATTIYEVAQRYNDADYPLQILYVGDLDPSGMFMSEEDIPTRLTKYEGEGVLIRRIALVPAQTRGLLSFPASDKKKDPRFSWFIKHYGMNCWELDAMDPNVLRDLVEKEILSMIKDKEAWERCQTVNRAEQASMIDYFDKWTFKPRKQSQTRSKKGSA